VLIVKKSIEALIKAPEEVAADRGFYSSENEEEIRGFKVKHIAIPKPGKKSEKRLKHKRQHWFKRLIRWRSGGKVTIGLLERKWGKYRHMGKSVHFYPQCQQVNKNYGSNLLKNGGVKVTRINLS